MQIQDLVDRYQKGERDFSHADLSGASLSGVNLQDADLTGANLAEANLSWALLNRAILVGASLRRADLHSASLNRANLTQANLNGATLTKVDLRLAELPEADLNWATLEEADLSGANVRSAKLDQVNLERAKLNGTCLDGADLMEANLRRASLASASLNQANLREAHLEEANLREASLIGANLIEANLSGASLRQANLSEADLHRGILLGVDLSEAVVSSADLSRVNLAGAYLLKTSFKKAYLLRANLQDVYLLRADLSEANLRGSDLRRADLSGAFLGDACLSEADLSHAYLIESHLIRTNLDGAQMTGCCIYNWHPEDLDLSKVNCRYVLTQFNFTTKQPSDRYPVGRELLPGELGQQYQQDSAAIEVYLTEMPNWEALVFTLEQVQLEGEDLTLVIQSYEPAEDNFLLRLTANRPVNAKLLGRQILQLYPQMLQRWLSKRAEIFSLLAIVPPAVSPGAVQNGTVPAAATNGKVTGDRRQKLYQEVVRQIQSIVASQAPDRMVEAVQRLLLYLHREGVATEAIQKKLIGQVIVQRARQDRQFRQELYRWEQGAPEEVRSSPVGQAVRTAIAQFSSQSLQP